MGKLNQWNSTVKVFLKLQKKKLERFCSKQDMQFEITKGNSLNFVIFKNKKFLLDNIMNTHLEKCLKTSDFMIKKEDRFHDLVWLTLNAGCSNFVL